MMVKLLFGLACIAAGGGGYASVTHSRLWLPFEIRQRYDTKSEKVGLLSSMIGNVLSLSERSRIRS